jgi:hypothetical protein
VRGILDLGKPWRLALAGLFLGAGLYGGYRSFIGVMILLFAITFFLEGLHRTRYALVVVLLGLLCLVGLISFGTKLPLPVQRALSFLPIEFQPMVKQDARGSLDWRLEMWKNLTPQIPRYLLKGKGYALDPGDLYMASVNSALGLGPERAEGASLAGDYHNGPLSVVIPFGLWGVLAFGWFLIAAARVLYLNCIHGDPTLRTINRLLFACFIARTFFFIILVGSLDADLPYLAGLIGMAVSLNGETRDSAQAEEFEAIPDMAVARTGGSV